MSAISPCAHKAARACSSSSPSCCICAKWPVENEIRFSAEYCTLCRSNWSFNPSRYSPTQPRTLANERVVAAAAVASAAVSKAAKKRQAKQRRAEQRRAEQGSSTQGSSSRDADGPSPHPASLHPSSVLSSESTLGQLLSEDIPDEFTNRNPRPRAGLEPAVWSATSRTTVISSADSRLSEDVSQLGLGDIPHELTTRNLRQQSGPPPVTGSTTGRTSVTSNRHAPLSEDNNSWTDPDPFYPVRRPPATSFDDFNLRETAPTPAPSMSRFAPPSFNLFTNRMTARNLNPFDLLQSAPDLSSSMAQLRSMQSWTTAASSHVLSASSQVLSASSHVLSASSQVLSASSQALSNFGSSTTAPEDLPPVVSSPTTSPPASRPAAPGPSFPSSTSTARNTSTNDLLPSSPATRPVVSRLSDLAKIAENACILLQLFSQSATSTNTVTSDQLALVNNAFSSIVHLRASLGLSEPQQPDTEAKPAERDEELMVSSGCVVCYDNVVDTVMMPCMHLALCAQCCARMGVRKGGGEKCPICRAVVTDVIKIFRVCA